MRFYTVDMNGAEKVMISVDGGKKGFLTEDLGFEFRDMNELILAAEKDTALLKKLENAAEGSAASQEIKGAFLLQAACSHRPAAAGCGLSRHQL